MVAPKQSTRIWVVPDKNQPLKVYFHVAVPEKHKIAIETWLREEGLQDKLYRAGDIWFATIGNLTDYFIKLAELTKRR